ncbi:hypothetical protein FOMG_18418 [Fusarium oxysporum f. sp. melonis 26406]|uniref:Uncharacterized protein n=1 Tax=Fusarium oxysporum f. sp. melonis 26406 TaxID=1089452 RepID=W9Z0G7_FUSOX|nr:hypothetical protein FOMG_18418 [Fusarium oxysporum f. sp. melonis 26406]
MQLVTAETTHGGNARILFGAVRLPGERAVRLADVFVRSIVVINYRKELYALRLIGLEKLDGGIRPFAIGDLIYKEITIKDLKYHGLKTLGTYIGPLEGRRAFLEEKLDTLQQAIAALQDLPKQHSLLLLRGSIHLLLRHLLRQLNPEGLSNLWERAVILIKEAIITLVARSPAERPEEPDPYLFSLPGLYKALGSRPYLNVEIEPLVQQDSSLRADLAVTIGNSRNFYDIQIVAISKDSAKEDPYSTLKEAANEKRRKYQSLGAFFHPLTFSAGGLMDQETSQTYKKLQELLGPFAASQLDLTIGLALTKTKAISAASIARDLPRRTHS